jgi:hypothetical protein
LSISPASCRVDPAGSEYRRRRTDRRDAASGTEVIPFVPTVGCSDSGRRCATG